MRRIYAFIKPLSFFGNEKTSFGGKLTSKLWCDIAKVMGGSNWDAFPFRYYEEIAIAAPLIRDRKYPLEEILNALKEMEGWRIIKSAELAESTDTLKK